MGASESSFFSFSLCVLPHMRLECIWALPQQTRWLLLIAEICGLTASAITYVLQSAPLMSSKFHLSIKHRNVIDIHLTWNTCGRLYELSIEVGNDSIAFFCWLHPEIVRDTKSISVLCSEEGVQVLSVACFLLGGWVHYLINPPWLQP